MSQPAARSLTTRDRILAGCKEAEADDDLGFLLLHWQDTAAVRLVYPVTPQDPTAQEIGEIFVMEVEKLHRPELGGDPRAVVSVLRELFSRPRSAEYQDRLLLIEPDNFAWLVEHWFDSHTQPGLPDSILGEPTGTYEVTTGELFLSEVTHPEGNPRAGLGALRWSCKPREDRE